MTARHSTRPAHAGRVAAGVAVLVLLLAFASSVLFPPPAHAAVDRKHARVYKAYVNAIARGIKNDQEAFNSHSEHLAEVAQDIIEMLATPPVDHDALVREEEQAAWLVSQIPTAVKMPEALKGMSDRLFTDGRPWFHSASDKLTFKRATHNVGSGALLIRTAYQHLREAAGELANDPPDIEKAREHNQQVAAAINLANPKFTKGLKALRALQR